MAEPRQYDVESLLKLAHEYKALRIKTGPIEIELSPTAFLQTQETQAAEQETQLPEDFVKIPSAEEMLFMAGLQLEKEAAPGVTADE